MSEFSRIVAGRGLLGGSPAPAPSGRRSSRRRRSPGGRRARSRTAGSSGWGPCGDPGAHDPVDVDFARLACCGGPAEITCCNRGVTLFEAGDARVRRIHRVCPRLMEVPGSGR